MRRMLATLALCSIVFAQSDDDPTQKIYDRYKFEKLMRGMEVEASMRKGDVAEAMFGKSEHANEQFRLQQLLEKRAKNGDPLAAFYSGLLKREMAQYINSKNPGSADEDFREAIRLFKQAGDGDRKSVA